MNKPESLSFETFRNKAVAGLAGLSLITGLTYGAEQDTAFAATQSIEAEANNETPLHTHDAPVKRYAGRDRYETAAIIAKESFEPQSVNTIFITRGQPVNGKPTYPDALVTGSVAGLADQFKKPLLPTSEGPVLLTGSEHLSPVTANIISYLASPDANIYVLGGPKAVSEKQDQELAQLVGGEVKRLSGADRRGTADAVWSEFIGDETYPNNIFISNGNNDLHTLTAATLAGYSDDGGSVPILTAGNLGFTELSRSRLHRLRDGGSNIVAIGATSRNALVNIGIEPSNFFDDSYGDELMVQSLQETFMPELDESIVVRSDDLIEGVTASAEAVRHRSIGEFAMPIFVPGGTVDTISEQVKSSLRRGHRAVLFGGKTALSQEVSYHVEDLVYATPDNQEFRNMSPDEMQNLWDDVSFDMPNVSSPSARPPHIIDSGGADERIRSLAFQRGYSLEPIHIGQFAYTSNGVPVPPESNHWFSEMSRAARANGISLSIRSAYRSPETQAYIFRRELNENCGYTGENCSTWGIANGQADRSINLVLDAHSVPGTSQHHSYAVDIGGVNSGTTTYNWLSANNFHNAKRFGFLPGYPFGVSYPNGARPDREEHHFVYVGTQYTRN